MAYDCEQSPGHDTPAGDDTTDPGPDTVTERVRESGTSGSNDAESSITPWYHAMPLTWIRYVVPAVTGTDTVDLQTPST